MKKLLAVALVFSAVGLFIAGAGAQKPTLPTRTLTLPCCKCLGEATTINLNTGQGTPTDPFWTVNGGPAYTTLPVSSWLALPPAKWIQPVATPTPSNSVPPGLYKYSVKFTLPKCAIPSTVRLSGRFAADNTVRALLDLNPIPGASCTTTIYCFKTPAAPIPLNVASIGPGTHVLTFEVKNESGPSGLIVNAQLSRQCAKEPILQDGPKTEQSEVKTE